MSLLLSADFDLALRPNSPDLERLGDEIAALSVQLDGTFGRLLVLIREFDDRQGWRMGFRSCADWLAWRTGLDLGAARERVRVARALGGLPRFAAALIGVSSPMPRSAR